nr:hypothetical protein [Tanacetum cinerariifolium]
MARGNFQLLRREGRFEDLILMAMVMGFSSQQVEVFWNEDESFPFFSEENFLKSPTAMAYSSSLLSEVELSSSLDSFLAFKAIDLLCSLLILTFLESFLITSS